MMRKARGKGLGDDFVDDRIASTKPVPKYGNPGTGKAWKERRQQVLDEETHCGICGDPVNKMASGAKGPSVDHIIPTSWGGSNDRENLRLAHRGCNSSLGQRQGRNAGLARMVTFSRAGAWLGRHGF